MDSVRYLKENPSYAGELYTKRANAPKDLAGRIVSLIDWTPNGRGTGQDLVAAVTNLWQFVKDVGTIPADVSVKVEDAVYVKFLQ